MDLEQDQHRFVNPPVYRGSTIFFKDYEEMNNGSSPYVYGRWGTPTSDYFCRNMSALESGFAAIATCSGLSAISTCFLALLKPGAHFIINQSAYPGVFRLLNELKTKILLEVEAISATQALYIKQYIKPNTQFVYWDMPGNHGIDVINIQLMKKAIGTIPLIIDNTWATPLFFNPLQLNADIVIHSASKYITGHSDSILGCIVFKEEKMFLSVLEMSRALGQYASADDLTLASRGLKTLAVRMQQHYNNALQVADWLTAQKAIEQVFYPPLKSSPNHSLWQAQFRGAGGLLTFVLKKDNDIARFLNQLQLIKLGWGWGGYESLASSLLISFKGYHQRPAIRLSVGLEQACDVIDDLANALAIL